MAEAFEIKDLLRFAKIICGKYDLIIDLQNSKRTNLYHFLSNAEKKCCSKRRKCGFEILQITAFRN